MKRRTISILIIVFNILLVVLTTYALYEEYIRVGKFQWVDKNAIEDHEELYFTPIFFCVVILGLLSFIHETLVLRGVRTQNTFLGTLSFLLKAMSYLYGTLLLIVCFIFISMTLGNIGNHDYEKGFELSVSIIILALLCVGLFGGLIIYNNSRSKNS